MSCKDSMSIVAILVLMTTLLLPATGIAELTQTEVSESLICYACPGEPLNIDRCSGGNQMRDVIKKMLLKKGSGGLCNGNAEIRTCCYGKVCCGAF